MKSVNIQLKSLITCPHCGHQKVETIPTDACQFFYECENCMEILNLKKAIAAFIVHMAAKTVRQFN